MAGDRFVRFVLLLCESCQLTIASRPISGLQLCHANSRNVPTQFCGPKCGSDVEGEIVVASLVAEYFARSLTHL
jgi:hypothetical protein